MSRRVLMVALTVAVLGSGAFLLADGRGEIGDVPLLSNQMNETLPVRVELGSSVDAPDELIAERTLAGCEGTLRGVIRSVDSSILAPFKVVWVSADGTSSGEVTSRESFTLEGLAYGTWHVAIWDAVEGPDDNAGDELVDAGLNLRDLAVQRAGASLLSTQEVVLNAEFADVEFVVGHSDATSARLMGHLVGPNIDSTLHYFVSIDQLDPAEESNDWRVPVASDFTFDFGNVRPGSSQYMLTVGVDSESMHQDTLLLGDVLLPEGRQKVLALDVPPHSQVVFRVVDGGTGALIDTAHVAWFASRDPQLSQGARVDLPIRDSAVIPPGEWLAVAHATGYAAAVTPFSSVGHRTTVDLVIDRADPKYVQLVDADGNAVRNAVVRVSRVDNSAMHLGLSPSTQTNDDAIFDASGMPGGMLRLEVTDISARRVGFIDVEARDVGERLMVSFR